MKFGSNLKRASTALMAAAILTAAAAPALAVNSANGTISDITPGQEQTQSYTYSAPTAPVAVNDNVVTATAHRAASPILGILGVNATSGFGMINGQAPTNLAEAEACPAMGVWGTSLNENPDPYYWNYFYNFYAEENGLEQTSDALINGNWSGSPTGADTTLFEEYGNISGSLYTRPDIVVGIGDGTDYANQLATIHSFTPDSPYYRAGDESYSPKLVVYDTTYIKQMIESVYRLADAINEVQQETGKTTRYGDVQVIASDYEKYVYGIIAYVQEELAAKGMNEKVVAVLTAINEDGTYTIANETTTSATSLSRAHEYSMTVSTNLADIYNATRDVTTTGRDGKETTTTENYVTLEQLLTADVIITINNQNITQNSLLESFGSEVYDGIIISNTPATLYGMTMNSVENAMGYAYIIGSMYSDVLDIDPVELCAYFYQHFLHISDLDGLDQVVRTNFSETILPEGVSATLPSDYSAAKVEAKLSKGISYYNANRSAFQTDEYTLIGMNAWNPDLTVGIGAAVSNPFTDVAQGEYYTDAVLWALGNGMISDNGSHTLNPMADCPRSEVFTYLWNANGKPSATIANPFTDVSASDPYYTAALWAYEKGLTTGTDAGTFSPSDIVTRAQMVTLLYRIAGEPAVSGSHSFADVAQGEYYTNPVIWAVANGLTTGTDENTYSPNQTLKRAEAITFLYRGR